MNRFALAAAGLLSIAGFAGAASGADLTARTTTKAPALVAPIYDWSGFTIGLNGGGASSHECLTITSVAGNAVFLNSEGCHNATGGLAGGPGRLSLAGRQWVFGVEAQGDWAN
jgi:outer membrane immunogenic protein